MADVYVTKMNTGDPPQLANKNTKVTDPSQTPLNVTWKNMSELTNYIYIYATQLICQNYKYIIYTNACHV